MTLVWSSHPLGDADPDVELLPTSGPVRLVGAVAWSCALHLAGALALWSMADSAPLPLAPKPQLTVALVTLPAAAPQPLAQTEPAVAMMPAPAEPSRLEMPAQVKPEPAPPVSLPAKPRPAPKRTVPAAPSAVPTTSAPAASEPAPAAVASAAPVAAPEPPALAVEAPPPVILNPAYRSRPTPPVYPRRARDLGQEGETTVRVRIDRSGNPEQVVVWQSSGFDMLDRAAVETARQWAFEPALRDGRPILAWVQIPVRFRLQ